MESQFNPPLLKITYIGSSSKSQTKKNYRRRISRVHDSILVDIYQPTLMTFPIRFTKNGDLYYIMSRIITYILIALFIELIWFMSVDWTHVDG